MRYYKVIEDGYIPMIGTGAGNVEITKEEYDLLRGIIYTMPNAGPGYAYRLRADNLAWEEYALPEVDPETEEISSDELMDMIAEVL